MHILTSHIKVQNLHTSYTHTCTHTHMCAHTHTYHDHFAATDGSFRCPIQPRLGLSKCGTQTISITWNLVRKVNSQPHLGPSESAAGEWGEEGTASKACR